MKKSVTTMILVVSTLFSLTSFAGQRPVGPTQAVCDTSTGLRYHFADDGKNTLFAQWSRGTGTPQVLDFEILSVRKASEIEANSASLKFLNVSERNKSRKITSGLVYNVKSIDDNAMGLYPRVGIFQVNDGSTLVTYFFKRNTTFDSKDCVK